MRTPMPNVRVPRSFSEAQRPGAKGGELRERRERREGTDQQGRQGRGNKRDRQIYMYLPIVCRLSRDVLLDRFTRVPRCMGVVVVERGLIYIV